MGRLGHNRLGDKPRAGLAALAGAGLHSQSVDLGAKPVTEFGRGAFTAATARHQGLHLLLDAVLTQARRALVQVLLDAAPPVLRTLEVEEEIHLIQDLTAADLMGMCGA